MGYTNIPPPASSFAIYERLGLDNSVGFVRNVKQHVVAIDGSLFYYDYNNSKIDRIGDTNNGIDMSVVNDGTYYKLCDDEGLALYLGDKHEISKFHIDSSFFARSILRYRGCRVEPYALLNVKSSSCYEDHRDEHLLKSDKTYLGKLFVLVSKGCVVHSVTQNMRTVDYEMNAPFDATFIYGNCYFQMTPKSDNAYLLCCNVYSNDSGTELKLAGSTLSRKANDFIEGLSFNKYHLFYIDNDDEYIDIHSRNPLKDVAPYYQKFYKILKGDDRCEVQLCEFINDKGYETIHESDDLPFDLRNKLGNEYNPVNMYNRTTYFFRVFRK